MNVEKEKIIEIIAQVLSKETDELARLEEGYDLREIGLDSITSIDVIVNLENAFNIAVDDDDLLIENFNTVEKLMLLLDKYISKVSRICP